MLPIPNYYNTEWYDKVTGKLNESAPEKIKNEYRFYHAEGYYMKKPWGDIVAEYRDEHGDYFVLNEQGKVIKKGRVDKTRYEQYDI